MSAFNLSRDQYLELEKLQLGVFAPLVGFMNEDEFHSVVDTLRLPNGEVFPLPVVLDIADAQKQEITGRPNVTLLFNGVEVGHIQPQSLFRCDKERTAIQVFGTNDPAHPGVSQLMNQREWLVGGPVALTNRASLGFSDWELEPAQTKAEFARRGWQTIVGFQTRNVPHRAHEYLQRVALEQVDGLFIQPLVGWKTSGDYTPAAIMTGYSRLIEEFFPKDRVVLSILSTAMRYAGPREAVFHALVRRNYGCTHFIVGRDHAGIGNYYELYEAQEMTRQFDGELGIEIMRLRGPFYCRRCGGIVTDKTCPHITAAPADTQQISGTEIRALFKNGENPGSHLMRPEVVESLSGIQLFIEDA